MRFPKLLSVAAILCFALVVHAQVPTQTIRGTVLDKDTQIPLIGATVQIMDIEESIGEVTDIDGRFRLEDIPVGRRTLIISYLGYEPLVLSNITLSSGKELVLNIELVESINELETVVVTAETDKRKPINDMATVSARSFSVEETSRYAASLQDPARMAQNYAGVTSAGDDLSNEIVIRGNSPSYVQWRLEGVEIPNPNHFSSKGRSGGGVSMLSSSMMANSDFYTGAFPAEIGNALAGAFDLKFRNGNNEQREHSIQFGAIGLEASTEGPLGNNGGSYLFNYRYSVLAILQKIGSLDFGDASPDYQDLSFKINLPTTKAGVFSIFGIGGKSIADGTAELDQSQWTDYDDLFTFSEGVDYGMIGLKHRYLFKNQKTYLNTVVSGSIDDYSYFEDFIDVQNNNETVNEEFESLIDRVIRLSSTLNHKANAKTSIRTGGILSFIGYDFFLSDRPLDFIGNFQINYGDPVIDIDDQGSSNMIQLFGQWKHRASEEWTINAGLHYTHLGLTGGSAFEPRASVKWDFKPKQSIALSAGLHSQAEHLINYTLLREVNGQATQPNLDLELTKAAHFVLGYDRNLSPKTRLKIEAYYQRLYDIPTDPTFNGGVIINAENVYDVLDESSILTNEGTGQNIGVDVTIERFLDKGFYYLMTGSLFESTVDGFDDQKLSTRYNSNFNLTVLGGKEWKTGKSKQNTFGANAKVLNNGGNRYTEFDFANFRPTDEGIFKLQADNYFRFDLSFNYRFNRPKTTHIIALEFQNLTNRQNTEATFPDFNRGTYRRSLQSGLLPNVYYRVQL